MSLTQEDLLQIRSIVEDVVTPLRGDIEALNNDIKEIYKMISDLQVEVAELKNTIAGPDSLQRMTTEQKIIRAYSDIVAVAKQAGVTLPR